MPESLLMQTSLRQMAILALFVGIGFLLAKCRILPTDAAKTLSKLESNVFIPCLVMGNFMTNFTADTLSTAWKLLLYSLIIELLLIPVVLLLARMLSKDDDFLRKIFTYGLAFSNFGFMGLPMIEALFPQYLLHYNIFALPLWMLNFGWGVPFLLMDRKESRNSSKTSELRASLKNLINPIILGMLLGALIGVTGRKLPGVITSVVTTCGACMSPLAMMLTGITFATIPVKKVLSNGKIYIVTALRLLVFPAACAGLYLLVTRLLGQTPAEYYFICLVCCAAMPLGLNSVVIPAGYGKDTSVAAGMVLISHALSVLTIPLILTLFL